MDLFDFIRHDKFRACLKNDYQELGQLMEGGCWKAAHVVAGSIVEAVLIEYLVASDYKKRAGKDPLTMDLSAAIDACRDEGVLSEKSAGLGEHGGKRSGGQKPGDPGVYGTANSL